MVHGCMARLTLGEMTEARAAIQRAAELAPDDDGVLELLSRLTASE